MASSTPSRIDSRYVFWAFAMVAGFGGVLLVAAGARLFHPESRTSEELIRILGGVLACFACFAAALARVRDPRDRRHGAGWFALGLALLGWTLLLQPNLNHSKAVSWMANGLIGATLALTFWWRNEDGEIRTGPILQGLFGGRKGGPERLRSRYEDQVRLAAGQEERKRLARDLHDSVKQQIFVMQTAAATAQARFDEDPTGARAALEQLRQAAREAMTEMEAMLDQLQAAPLDNAGLVEAVKKQAEALGFRTGAKIHFTVGQLPPAGSTEPGAHETLFRAAQQALANAGRHARAANVWIHLDAVAGDFMLRVRDDGGGFDLNRPAGGMGLANLRTRAEECGGDFEIESREGAAGTTVTFRVPYVQPRRASYGRDALIAAGLLIAAILMFRRTGGNQSFIFVIVLAGIELARQLAGYVRTRHARTAAQ